VLWIDARSGPPVYIRQVDVPGVDTKFIERHEGTLAALLDAQLDPARVDTSRPRSEFAARYGFRSPPNRLWLRSLDPSRRLAGAYAELAVRREDLATAPPPHGRVYVVENKVTYLAFPTTADAVAIFGGGYAVPALAEQRWLAHRNLFYTGDIDTHGFVILDRLRQQFHHTRSLLMDRATLLAHETQWVQEREPVATHLAHLARRKPICTATSLKTLSARPSGWSRSASPTRRLKPQSGDPSASSLGPPSCTAEGNEFRSEASQPAPRSSRLQAAMRFWMRVVWSGSMPAAVQSSGSKRRMASSASANRGRVKPLSLAAARSRRVAGR
jgi:hypothetical protein